MTPMQTPYVLTMVAASDLSGDIYRFAAGDGTGKVVRAGAASANSTTAVGVLGVIYNTAKSGEAVSIAYVGRSLVQAGTSLSAFNFITSGSGGCAVAAQSGDIVKGQLIAALIPGQIGEVELCQPFRLFGAN